MRNSKVIKRLDERFSKDTLDLQKYGNEYIFERHIIEMMQKNVPREEILNAISTQYNAIQEIKIKLKVDKSWESKPF